jgi:hypothetical protein
MNNLHTIAPASDIKPKFLAKAFGMVQAFPERDYRFRVTDWGIDYQILQCKRMSSRAPQWHDITAASATYTRTIEMQGDIYKELWRFE